MSDRGSGETRCGNCGRAIDEVSDLPVEDRGPCDRCGSRSRKFHVELHSSITATSTVTARLTSHPGQVTQVGTATETEVAHQVSPVQGSVPDRETGFIAPEALPTEVIAECLRVGINLLPPDDSGQWPIEVEAFGVIGHVGVGTLDDGLAEAMVWLQGLAERWHQRLQEGTVE